MDGAHVSGAAGVGIAIAALLGLGAMGGGSRRGASGDAAARAALRAPNNVASRPDFISPRDPRGRVILPGEGDIQRVSGVGVGAGELAAVRTRRARPSEARRLAGPLARALRKGEPAPVERSDVRAFQRAAGLIANGLYDRATADALRHYGIRNAPPPFFLGGDA